MHYSKRLTEKYPQYSKEQIYYFITSCFLYIQSIVQKVNEFKTDVNILLGPFIRLNFRYYSHKKYMEIMSEVMKKIRKE